MTRGCRRTAVTCISRWSRATGGCSRAPRRPISTTTSPPIMTSLWPGWTRRRWKSSASRSATRSTRAATASPTSSWPSSNAGAARRLGPEDRRGLDRRAGDWPSNREGLVYLFETADKPNQVPSADGRPERGYAIRPRGRARLDHNYAMVLAGGSFLAERGRQRPPRRVSQEQPTDRRGVDPPGPSRPVGARPDRHFLQQRVQPQLHARAGAGQAHLPAPHAEGRRQRRQSRDDRCAPSRPGRRCMWSSRTGRGNWWATSTARKFIAGKASREISPTGRPITCSSATNSTATATGRGRSKASPSTTAPSSRARSSAMRPSTTTCCGRASRSRRSRWRRSWSRSPRSRRSRRSSRTVRP